MQKHESASGYILHKCVTEDVPSHRCQKEREEYVMKELSKAPEVEFNNTLFEESMAKYLEGEPQSLVI
jgi:NaMN:DMB phosphoribosyltransferase